MRIVTRPDFDGIVCAALLLEVEPITQPIKWAQPSDMQKGRIDISNEDIIANLPYSEHCALWFDHHVTNKLAKPFKGAFRIAPSAARVIHDHYANRFEKDFQDLVKNTDDIDAANLTQDQVRHPENYPFILLSMTIGGQDEDEEAYWNHLVQLLRTDSIENIVADPVVAQRCRETISRNKEYEVYLKRYTHLNSHVAITDFRSLSPPPDGNRFLAYSLFPDAIVSVRIRHADLEKRQVTVSVGHSIFNRRCVVNVGMMLSKFGGGGHAGAGACTFAQEKSNDVIPRIIDLLNGLNFH
ncbi:MAG: exopolyphosphatase [Deltaproteobacteria bacterium]|nr:exopolyphosphatase [Deltaproteobacteria bacterium]